MDLGTAGAFASIIGLVLVLLDFVTRGRRARVLRLFGWLWGRRRLRVSVPGEPAPPPILHAQSIRTSVNDVRVDGLITDAPTNEAIVLVLNINNYSGFPIRVNAMHGHMVIDGERQEPPPTLVTTADIPYPGTRSVEVRQVVPGMRGRMSAKGMEGKFAIYAFNLSNLRFDCEARMPDGSTRDVECTPGEPHFLVRGPLQDDADFANLTRVSITFGSQRWYGADGPNEDWRGRT